MSDKKNKRERGDGEESGNGEEGQEQSGRIATAITTCPALNFQQLEAQLLRQNPYLRSASLNDNTRDPALNLKMGVNN